jgi:serine phosphatase RsbU (regulator of sigma subunit)
MEVWGGNETADSAVSMPGLEVFIYSRPYANSQVGGDVHYVSRCGTGRIARLLVADVSGHGAEVSEIAINLRNLMRKFVNFLDQSRFVESLNREFAGSSVGGNFATAVVGTFWAPTQYLVTCNAGHPPPLHFRRALGKWEYLDPASEQSGDGPANLPLGIIEPTRYDAHGVRLEAGDMVLIYTDSLTEARGVSGELLGEKRLLEMLNSLVSVAPQQLTSRMCAKIAAWTGGADPGDDMTMLLLHATGVPMPRRTLKESINAVWLFAGLVASRLAGGSTPIPWPELRLANIGGAILPKLNLSWGRPKGG